MCPVPSIVIRFPSLDFYFVQKTCCMRERAGQRLVATRYTMNFHKPHGKTTDAALWHIRPYLVFAITAKAVEEPIETRPKTHHQRKIAPKFVRHRVDSLIG